MQRIVVSRSLAVGDPIQPVCICDAITGQYQLGLTIARSTPRRMELADRPAAHKRVILGLDRMGQ